MSKLNKVKMSIATAVLLLSILVTSLVIAANPPASGDQIQTDGANSGVTYYQGTIAGREVNGMNVLRFTPSDNLRVMLSTVPLRGGSAQSVLQQAQSMQAALTASGSDAIVLGAITGDFANAANQPPFGMFMNSSGEWIKSSNLGYHALMGTDLDTEAWGFSTDGGNHALGIASNGNSLVGPTPDISLRANATRGGTAVAGFNNIAISALNQMMGASGRLHTNGTVLYTSDWGATTQTVTTGTTPVTREVRLSVSEQNLRNGGTVVGTVVSNNTTPNTAIGDGHVVISVYGNGGTGGAQWANLQTGDVVTINVDVSTWWDGRGGEFPSTAAHANAAAWRAMDNIIIGGSAPLVVNGAIAPHASRNTEGGMLHANRGRTVVGVTAAGEVIFMTVDDTSGAAGGAATNPGATGTAVANRLIEMGAVNAINLDGGGSTQMVVRGSDGTFSFVNNPRQGLTGLAPGTTATPAFPDPAAIRTLTNAVMIVYYPDAIDVSTPESLPESVVVSEPIESTPVSIEPPESAPPISAPESTTPPASTPVSDGGVGGGAVGTQSAAPTTSAPAGTSIAPSPGTSDFGPFGNIALLLGVLGIILSSGYILLTLANRSRVTVRKD